MTSKIALFLALLSTATAALAGSMSNNAVITDSITLGTNAPKTNWLGIGTTAGTAYDGAAGAAASNQAAAALPRSGGSMTGNIATGTNWVSGDGDDEGIFISSLGLVGIGTTNPASVLHIRSGSEEIATNLLSTDKIILSGDNVAAGMSVFVAASGSIGTRGVYSCLRARGTLAAPESVTNTDFVFSLLGRAYDGYGVRANGDITMSVDGPVSSNQVPMAIVFSTSSGGARSESLRIGGDKTLKLSNCTNTPAAPVGGILLWSSNGVAYVMGTNGVSTKFSN
jgi:hypothetical protein